MGERIGSAAAATYNGAVALEDKYKIRENVAQGAKSTYKAAVEANEKHKITEVRTSQFCFSCKCQVGVCGGLPHPSSHP